MDKKAFLDYIKSKKVGKKSHKMSDGSKMADSDMKDKNAVKPKALKLAAILAKKPSAKGKAVKKLKKKK